MSRHATLARADVLSGQQQQRSDILKTKDMSITTTTTTHHHSLKG